jgi:outer membrane protein insertion porin family
MKLKKIYSLLLCMIILSSFSLKAQISIGDEKIDYTDPKEYLIGGITVSGIKYVDQSVIVMLSGLKVGDKIDVPGAQITDAIKKLWAQGLFEEISVNTTKIQGNLIFLDIFLTERPKLSKYTFSGLRKGEVDNVRDEIFLVRGESVTEHLLTKTKQQIRNYFVDKGYLNVDVNIRKVQDTAASNSLILFIDVKKNQRVKIKEIIIEGNDNMSSGKIRRTLKNTKQKNFFRLWKRSRFIRSSFEEDKNSVIAKYNTKGFRDASVEMDSLYKLEDGHLGLYMKITEGPKYFVRNVSWVGNTKYTDDELDAILNLQKGDIYNQELIDKKLFMNPEGFDVSSLYLDDGYLFFNLTPVELRVVNDSIDLELRISEGKQAVISNVLIQGNTRTNDYVIRREIRTKPGQLFSRSDIIRTQQELAQLRYFDNNSLGLDYDPNPQEGTVDLEYQVEETSSDQIELSGGWGGGRVIGTLGISFNNFSIKNIFNKKAWRPLPTGDGQKLSVRAQSYGLGYYNVSASFTEPWLGGRKPRSLSITAYHSAFSNALDKGDPDRYSFKINGVVLGIGQRLKKPDDFFVMQANVSFQNYVLENYSLIDAFNNGSANNFSLGLSLSRNSTDDWIYPSKGSEIEASVQFTPMYSWFNNKDYNTLDPEDKYKWIEYHKWKFKSSYFINLFGNLVLHTRAKLGFLGSYNKEIGITPFERFYLGGDGLSGINQFDGREIIGMRGYGNSNLNPRDNNNSFVGGAIYNKYSMELRYAVSKNPMSTIYLMGYFEAGNAWDRYDKYNPFELRRTAGVGLRIYLPMFGILGLDYAWGLDEIPGVKTAMDPMFHFSINNSID